MSTPSNGNTTPIRIGSNAALAGNATPFDLFLKVFSGEVLTAFEGTTVMKDLHTIRTINYGRSAQFPVTGTAVATYHTPGESIANKNNSYLSDFKFSEKKIAIDGKLISAAFVPDVDELMNHYDARSIISTELGRALAYAFDQQVMFTLFAAARQTTANIPNATSASGEALTGKIIKKANMTTDARVLIDGIYEAVETLDKKDIPADRRYVLLAPAQYYRLINSYEAGNKHLAGVLVNSDFAQNNGSIVTGKVYEVAGCRIVKSNFVPVGKNLMDTDSGTAGNQPDPLFGNAAVRNTPFPGDSGLTGGVKYAGNFTKTVGAVFHPAAVGTVKLLDLAMESEYQIERQGTLMVAKMMTGSGVLRPECAVELSLPD
jgi:hypothetical protein